MRSGNTKGKTTSLGLLFIAIMFFMSWVFAGAHLYAQNPKSDNIDVDASVPLAAANITQPKNGQRFSAIPITVRGTCGAATTVEIYKNDIFAGSTTCNNGTFSIKIDLVEGRNVLIAKNRASDGTYGPDSSPVTVFYDVPAKPRSSQPTREQAALDQLIITTNTLYRGVNVGDILLITVKIIGGQAPYEVNIDWGDGNTETIDRANSGQFSVVHTYAQGGSFEIQLSASDSPGQQARVQTVAIVDPLPTPGLIQRISQGLTWLDYLIMYLVLLLISILLSILSYRRGFHRGVQIARKEVYKTQQTDNPAD